MKIACGYGLHDLDFFPIFSVNTLGTALVSTFTYCLISQSSKNLLIPHFWGYGWVGLAFKSSVFGISSLILLEGYYVTGLLNLRKKRERPIYVPESETIN